MLGNLRIMAYEGRKYQSGDFEAKKKNKQGWLRVERMKGLRNDYFEIESLANLLKRQEL